MDKTHKLIKKASESLAKRNFAAAEIILKKIVRKQPRHLDANYLLGTCLAEQGKIRPSIEFLRRAEAINPASPYVQNNLAIVYKTARNLDQARVHLEKALALQPDFADAHYNMAVVCDLMQSEADVAIQHYQAARKDSRFTHRAIAGIAQICASVGDYDKAEELLNPYFDRPVQDPILLHVLARHLIHMRKPKPLLEKTASVIRALRKEHTSLGREESDVLFDLAQLEDRLGRKETAMEILREVNATHEKEIGKVDFSEAYKIVSADLASTSPPSASEQPRVIFIVGMPRSGSTLYEQILHAHKHTLALGECEYLARTLTANGFTLTQGTKAIDDSLARKIRSDYLAMARDEGDARVLVDKTLDNYLRLGPILRAFPDARVIYCRRDPFSTCMSNYFLAFSGKLDFAYSLETLGRTQNSIANLMRIAAARFPEHCRAIDYEFLVEQPDEAIRRLLSLCGLEWDDACLRYYNAKRRVNTASAQQVMQPIYRDAIGRYEAFRPLAPELTAILQSGKSFL